MRKRNIQTTHNKTIYSIMRGLLRKRVWRVAQNHSQVQQPRVPRKNGKRQNNIITRRAVEPKSSSRHLKPDKNWNVKIYVSFVFFLNSLFNYCLTDYYFSIVFRWAQKVCIKKEAVAMQSSYAPNMARYPQHKFKNGTNLVQTDPTYPTFSWDGFTRFV